jgi:hypothetical protein
VLLDGVANIAFRFFDRRAIAEAAGQGWTVSQVPLVIGLLLNHDFERIELHGASLIGTVL